MAKDNVDLICSISEKAGLFDKSEDLNDFLQSVVSTIAYHMKAAVCSIYLFDESSSELVLAANQGLSSEAVGHLRLKFGEGITGLALREMRPICEGRGSLHPQYKFIPDLGEENYESFLAVPILRGMQRIAVIVLQDPEPNYFKKNDEKALRAIAAQLANTIENAKLLIDLHEEVDQGGKTERAKPEQKSFFTRGEVGSPGIAIGKAVQLAGQTYEALAENSENGSQRTLEDFNKALEATEQQLKKLQQQMEEEQADVASLIFSAHFLIVKDPEFSDSMRNLIKGGSSPEEAIVQVVNQFIGLFEKSKNPRLQEKVQDLKDLGYRLMHNLVGRADEEADYTHHIVIAADLLPSDLLKLTAQNVEGIITTEGGITSHISILATSLDIPLLHTENQRIAELEEETPVILDAEQGTIFVNPTDDVIRNYKQILEAKKDLTQQASDVEPETYTRDGTRITLLANVNLLSDLAIAEEFKAEGVGLYRSEFPFLVRANFPSEEEQFVIYKRIFETVGDQEVTFRTLDVGGDKILPYHEHVDEEMNPFLGMRGIRFSLRYPVIFCQQLRAMLRAGYGRELNIMFPMVTSLDDFLSAKGIVNECIYELQIEGVAHNSQPNLGVMIEVPSAVEVVNELAEEVQFLSIGTNDLIQYMLAVDRTNQNVADLYINFHPAVLRAMNKVADAAIRNDIHLSICGKMASDPHMLAFLLGIGIKKLSLAPRSIPGVQKAIQQMHIEDAHFAARKMIGYGEISEIVQFLKNHMAKTDG